MNIRIINTWVFLLAMIFQAQAQTPLDSDFTYQGELVFNDQPVDGLYDFEISAFDASTSGNQYDTTQAFFAVEVSNGIFTLNLNFGDIAFIGNQVFLEISLRESGSGDSFDLLSPRQIINNTPYAIHAQFVGKDSVTSDEIMDASILTQDLVNGSVTSDKIAADAVGSTAINSNEVQRRITEACPSDHYIQSINESGTVNCQLDAGGITEVTSADIVDGTIATIDIADNAITNSKLASDVISEAQMQDNSVGSNEIINNSIQSDDLSINSVTSAAISPNAVGQIEIDSNEVQRRITGVCPIGSYVRSINEFGSVNCQSDAIGLSEVTSTEIVNGTIITIDIADNAITNSKLATNVINEAQMQDNSVGSNEIINNSIQSFDLAANSVTSAAISPNAVGSSEIATGAVNFSEIATNAVGASEIAENAVGSSEIASNAVGSNELAANSVGASEIIANAVGSSEIAANAVGVSEINSAEVQQRVNHTCAEGYYLNGINQDGSVTCIQLPFGTSILTDTNGPGGTYTNITIRPSNQLPIISYHQTYSSLANYYNLAVYDCADINCNSGTERIIDEGNHVGSYNSMTIIPLTGLPAISYYDQTNGDLKIYFCQNINCSTGNSRVLDSSGDVGSHTSITINDSGYPIISYYDVTNTSLKVHTCFNSTCTTGNNFTLDNSADVGQYSNITIENTSGFPVISYYDETNGDLKGYICNNTFCSTGTSRTLDSVGNVGKYTSIADSILINAHPLISYYDEDNGNLKAYYCNNSSCSSGSAYNLDESNDMGLFTDIIINGQGSPLITFFNQSNSSLNLYECENKSCSEGHSRILDNNGYVGSYSSISLSSSGKPIISYAHSTLYESNLKIHNCADIYCSQ
ncbi:MAG: hypothetical protein ACSHWU_02615 [Marinicella sp.]